MNIRRELREVGYYLRRQLTLKIPSVSGLAALLVAGWVASSFTTSPIRHFFARAGWVRDSRHYVRSATYQRLAIGLPFLAAAITAYGVNRVLRARRAFWLRQDAMIVARLADRQREVQRRERVLDEALQLGLLSAAEHENKRSALYACYAREAGNGLGKLLAGKLT